MASTANRYSPELGGRACRMVLELLGDPVTARGAVQRVADQLGIHESMLWSWLKQMQVDQGLRPGTTTADAERIAVVEPENRELKRAHEILWSVSAFFGGSGARPQTGVVVVSIDAHRDRVVAGKPLGVEPIIEGFGYSRYRDRPGQLFTSPKYVHPQLGRCGTLNWCR
jgi:transposase